MVLTRTMRAAKGDGEAPGLWLCVSVTWVLRHTRCMGILTYYPRVSAIGGPPVFLLPSALNGPMKTDNCVHVCGHVGACVHCR